MCLIAKQTRISANFGHANGGFCTDSRCHSLQEYILQIFKLFQFDFYLYQSKYNIND